MRERERERMTKTRERARPTLHMERDTIRKPAAPTTIPEPRTNQHTSDRAEPDCEKGEAPVGGEERQAIRLRSREIKRGRERG